MCRRDWPTYLLNMSMKVLNHFSRQPVQSLTVANLPWCNLRLFSLIHSFCDEVAKARAAGWTQLTAPDCDAAAWWGRKSGKIPTNISFIIWKKNRNFTKFLPKKYFQSYLRTRNEQPVLGLIHRGLRANLCMSEQSGFFTLSLHPDISS